MGRAYRSLNGGSFNADNFRLALAIVLGDYDLVPVVRAEAHTLAKRLESYHPSRAVAEGPRLPSTDSP